MILEKRDVIEIVGGITVVVSLLFVGLQVMQERQFAQSQSAREVMEGLREFNREIATNEDVATLFYSGLSDYEGLDPFQRFRISYLFSDNILTLRDAQISYEQGVLSEEDFNALGRAVGRYLNTPGGRSYWQYAKQQFSEDLQELAELFREQSPSYFDARPDVSQD